MMQPIAAANKTLSLRPDLVPTRICLGQALIGAGEYPEAIKVLNLGAG